jgi:Tol biopolymer transport system component
VYSTDRGNFATGAMRLMLLDVATGVSLSMATLGEHPAWSPVNDEIAFIWGDLRIVKPDGTGELVLAKPPLPGRSTQISWSPDGKWISICLQGRSSGDVNVALVERATGEILPLAFTAKDKLCESTWKP